MTDNNSGGAAAALTVDASSLAPELRGSLEAKGWIKDGQLDVAQLAPGYGNLEKLVGFDRVALPAKDAQGGRDWSKWDGFAQLGRPEKAEGYSFKMPEGVEASDADKAFHAALAPSLHQAGLNQWQVGIVNEAWNGITAKAKQAQQEAVTAEMQAGEQALRAEFGDKFDDMMAMGNRAIDKFGGKELVAELERVGLARSPLLAKALIAIGQGLAEDNDLPGGNKGGGGGGGNADAELRRLEADPDFVKAYLSDGHPGHAEAVKRMNAAIAAADAASRRSK